MREIIVGTESEVDDLTQLVLWSLILCLSNLLLIFAVPAFARAVDLMGLS